MNKTLLQRFLLNCNKIPPHCTCQGWLINQSPLDKQNFQVSDPPGIHVRCHASVTRGRDIYRDTGVRETWSETGQQMKMYTLYTMLVRCADPGEGGYLCTIDSSKHDTIIRFWVFEYQSQGLWSLRQFGRLEKSHQRVIMGIMRLVMPWSLCLVTQQQSGVITTFHRTMARLSLGPGSSDRARSSDWASDSALKYRQQTVCTLLSTGLINMHFYGIVFVKGRSKRKSLKYIFILSSVHSNTVCTRDPVTAPVPSLTLWSRSQHTPPRPGRALVGLLQCWSLIGQIAAMLISHWSDY